MNQGTFTVLFILELPWSPHYWQIPLGPFSILDPVPNLLSS